MNRFWNWDYFGEYVAFLLIFIATIGTIALLNLAFFHAAWLTELIGFLALMIEATLAMPQFYKNYMNKSCYGLR